jgi:hypothetical protein
MGAAVVVVEVEMETVVARVMVAEAEVEKGPGNASLMAKGCFVGHHNELRRDGNITICESSVWQTIQI